MSVLGLNNSQIASGVRMVILFTGGFLVAKGLVSQDLVDRASDINTITGVVAAIGTLVTAVYGVAKRSDASMIKAASDISSVKEITVTDPGLGNKVQQAGGSGIRIVSTY